MRRIRTLRSQLIGWLAVPLLVLWLISTLVDYDIAKRFVNLAYDRQLLEAALDIRWLDGSWSEVWPLILRMSNLKERDDGFLDAAQRLRDTALDEVEGIAIAATGESRR